MAYAYWKSGKTNDVATFDLYFRCVEYFIVLDCVS